MTGSNQSIDRQTSLLLAIDTSSSQAGVALFDGSSLASRSWAADRSHTTTLLREIHGVLDAVGGQIKDLAAVAIAMGPGAFTGLRVGFGVAKGFHLATGVPMIGVSTLESAAFPFGACGCPVVTVVAAGRNRLIWATYLAEARGMTELAPPRNGVAEELAQELRSHEKIIVTGELNETQEAVLVNENSVILPPSPLRLRQPGALAHLGWQRWKVGDVDNPVTLEPVYLSR